MYRDIANEHQTTLVSNLVQPLTENVSLISEDGIHPNEQAGIFIYKHFLSKSIRSALNCNYNKNGKEQGLSQ